MWESNLKGPELLMAVAIADHADTDGRCFPGLDTLAAKVKLKKRQVQEIIHRLEKRGIIKTVPGKGRGHHTVFEFQKVQDSAPIPKAKRCSPPQIKGAGLCTEKVQDSAPPYKEEPLIEPLIEPEGEKPAPTFAHPALKAIREITKSNPPQEVWAPLIRVLGTEFDFARLMTCFQKWRLKGYREKNYGWITDWYANGVPEDKNGTDKNHASATEKSGRRGINAKAMVEQLKQRGLAERAAKAGQPLLGNGNGSNSS
jgi:hypothetical protein